MVRETAIELGLVCGGAYCVSAPIAPGECVQLGLENVSPVYLATRGRGVRTLVSRGAGQPGLSCYVRCHCVHGMYTAGCIEHRSGCTKPLSYLITVVIKCARLFKRVAKKTHGHAFGSFRDTEHSVWRVPGLGIPRVLIP